jgi:hypothetical protein
MLSKVLFAVALLMGVGIDLAFADDGKGAVDAPRLELTDRPLAVDAWPALDPKWADVPGLVPPALIIDATDSAALFHLASLEDLEIGERTALRRLAVTPVAGIATSLFAYPVATPDGDTHEANDDRAADAFFFAGFQRRFTGLAQYLPR